MTPAEARERLTLIRDTESGVYDSRFSISAQDREALEMGINALQNAWEIALHEWLVMEQGYNDVDAEYIIGEIKSKIMEV